MKTFLKVMLLALLLLGSFGTLLFLTAQRAQARPIDDLVKASTRVAVVKTIDPTVLQVLVESVSSQPVIVELKNQQGTIVWDRQFSAKLSTFRFRLNLTEVPDGHYIVVVRQGKSQTTYPITLTTTPAQEANRTVEVR